MLKHARPRPRGRRLWPAFRVAIPACLVIAAVIIAVRLSFPGTTVTDEAGRKSPPAGIGALAKIASSTAFEGTNAVGALFTKNGSSLGSHFCSASVVHSAKGNLLITAAHCMAGLSLRAPNGVVFAPGYHDGKFPLGEWIVTAIYVTSRWTAQQDPNDDVAFLTVANAANSSVTVEQAAGAEQLSDVITVPTQAEVIGYPDGSEQPVTCVAPAVPYQIGGLRQLQFTCNGYTTGTSGGPFLINVDPATGDGTVIGVIGGYQQGGFTPMVTYSSEFLDNVAALYKIATSP